MPKGASGRRDHLGRVGAGVGGQGSGGGTVCGTWDSRRKSVVGPHPFAFRSPPLQLIVADGFTDFTRTQHEILEILAAEAEEMYISLPLEPGRGAKDLFSKPLQTLSKLKSWHLDVQIEELPRPQPPPWPAMAYLEAKLFINPRGRSPPRLPPDWKSLPPLGKSAKSS